SLTYPFDDPLVFHSSLHDALPICPRRFRKQPAYFWNNIPPVTDLSDQSGSGWLFKELAIKNKALKRLGLQSDNATPRMEKCLSRSEEHTSELQSRENLVCRLLLEK